MKLHLNSSAGLNTVTGHGAGFVQVNQTRVETHLILMPDQLISPWVIANIGALSLVDFTLLIEMKPELVVFGSGAAFRFPDAQIMAAFSQARIGFEVMDTPAACRTYNVLMGEGRNVAAALLIGPN
jgi:uncharacterized protein